MARKQFNIRLSEAQKTRWEEYVDENPEHDTLTDLIRVAVEREIASEGNPAQLTGATDERVGEVLETLNELDGRFDSFDNQLSDIHEMLWSFVPNDMEQLAPVYAIVPVGRENAKTASEIAEKGNMYSRDVEMILGQLAINVDELKVDFEDDKRLYYRTEDSADNVGDAWS
jgi:hypothetical protein